MKKIISFIIVSMFILSGAGYSLPNTAYEKTSLRNPMMFRKGFSAGLALQMDETRCQVLSGKIKQELGLRRVRNELPVDGKLTCDGIDYGWEQSGSSLPRGKAITGENGGQGTYLVRVGYLFFLDKSKYDQLSYGLKEELGNNIILIDKLYESDLGQVKLLSYTMGAIAVMLSSRDDMNGKRIIDAGSGDGILALVAAKFGAAKVDLIEINHDKIVMARRNLKLNGLIEGVDFKMIEADIKDTKKVTGGLTSTELETVIISNIGTWPDLYGNVSNADALSLIDKIPGVVLFIAGGYTIGGSTNYLVEKRSKIVNEDQRLLMQHGFIIDEAAQGMFFVQGETICWINIAWLGRLKHDTVPSGKTASAQLSPALASNEKLFLKERIPMNFKLKPSGEKLAIIQLNAEIFEIYRAAIVSIAKTLYDQSPVQSLEFSGAKEVNGQACYLAKLDGNAAGYIFAYKENNRLNIYTLGVSPSEEQKGIANALVWIVAREARNRNIGTIAVKGVDIANKDMLDFLGRHEFTSVRHVDGGRRADFEAPAAAVLEKTSEKLGRDLVIDEGSGLLKRLGVLFNATRTFL
ncbi:MAG: GNAT family N-acetyltransferase [Candidatus Omnitrophica bacterium]|nr:GNAT family N-acetyltransferase [Candidatus Omnitrophota bacterium]